MASQMLMVSSDLFLCLLVNLDSGHVIPSPRQQEADNELYGGSDVHKGERQEKKGERNCNKRSHCSMGI